MLRSIWALGLVLFLAACGGGGGSGGGGPSMPSVSAHPQTKHGAARTTTQSLPVFGSVTQSINRNVANITTDAASLTFNGQDLYATITREDGSTIHINSADHLATPIEQDISVTTGRAFASAYAENVTNESTTIARGGVDWDSADPTDWLGGGYWIHISHPSGVAQGVEVGAFIDGPEISGRPTLPVTGTATYAGISAGLYTTLYGRDLGITGSTEVGEYEGRLVMTADFADASVSGRVDNIRIQGMYTDGITGGTQFIAPHLTDYAGNLGRLSIAGDGTFRGSGVALSSPTIPITSSSGNWGGRFSTVPDKAGNPRIVAGTLAGEAATAGGTSTAFIGAFYGATPDFQ